MRASNGSSAKKSSEMNVEKAVHLAGGGEEGRPKSSPNDFERCDDVNIAKVVLLSFPMSPQHHTLHQCIHFCVTIISI